jgi:hypothetical protein
MTHADKHHIGLILAVLVLCTGISAGAWARDGHGSHGGGPHGSHGGGHNNWSRGGYGHGGHVGSHTNFGFYIGAPLFWWPDAYYYPSYYYPPYYYYPRSRVYIEEESPVYIQRNDTAAASTTPPASYWYYCQNPQGYYPYVKECPGGWMKVVPQTPPNQ